MTWHHGERLTFLLRKVQWRVLWRGRNRTLVLFRWAPSQETTDSESGADDV